MRTDPLIVCAHGWSPIDGKKLFNNGMLSTPPAIAMYYFSKKLSKETDCDTLQLICQNSKNRSLSEISSTVKDVLKTYSSRKIIFVGHSMGGLIGFNDYVDAHVFIGVPFKGSRFSPPKQFSISANEMQKDSQFLLRVPESLSKPSLAILPMADAVVSRNSATGPCRDSQVIPWSTHLSILLNKRTTQEVASWINYSILDKDPTKTYAGIPYHSSVSL